MHHLCVFLVKLLDERALREFPTLSFFFLITTKYTTTSIFNKLWFLNDFYFFRTVVMMNGSICLWNLRYIHRDETHIVDIRYAVMYAAAVEKAIENTDTISQ